VSTGTQGLSSRQTCCGARGASACLCLRIIAARAALHHTRLQLRSSAGWRSCFRLPVPARLYTHMHLCL
jgi:hypothetical protein